MSLHYLLDGYNIIKQSPDLAPKKLEDGRRGLVQLIEIHRPCGSLNNKITIVFDGQAGVTSPVEPGAVRVIFSQDESADNKIQRLVVESANPKLIVVVTDDRQLGYAVKAGRAAVMSVKEFLAKCQPILSQPIDRRGQKPLPAGKHISSSVQHQITQEFSTIWLKKRKS